MPSAVHSVESFAQKQGESKKTVWTTVTIVATVVMLITGTMNTISLKYQNTRNYKHSMVQTATIFIGEYLNLLILGLLMIPIGKRTEHYVELKEKADDVVGKKKPKNANPSKLWCAIPSLCDTMASTLTTVPLLLMPASINQMLRGGAIVFTCFFRKWFLGAKVYRHHYLGVILLVIGFAVVGLASVVGGGVDAPAGVGGIIAGIIML